MTEYARLVVAVDSTDVRRSTDDLRRFSGESNKTERSAASLAGAVRAAATAFGAFKLTGLIKDAALANSRFDQLGLVMETVGRNAGYSSEEVNRYAKEVEAMGISMTESRQTVTRMIQAQMDLSKASELARLAQDAAVIANTNSSDALGRLIYGLQSGQTEILRNMGLNVQFERSYRQLAEQMGRTVDQLNEADRAQARMNAATEAGVQIAGAYEASMDSASKQLGSTVRYLQDLGVMAGGVFADATIQAVFGYSDALKQLHAQAKELEEDGTLSEWSESLSVAMSHADKVALLLAANVAGRLVPSLWAAVAAKSAATRQAILHQQALMGTIGISSTAATSLYALGAAATAASRAFALVGGPVGAAVIAAGAVYSFREELGLVPYNVERASREIDRLSRSMRNMREETAAVELLDAQKELALAERTIRRTASSLEQAQRARDRATNPVRITDLDEKIARLRETLRSTEESANGWREKMSLLNGVLDGTQSKTNDLREKLDATALAISRQRRETVSLGVDTKGLQEEIDRTIAGLDDEIRTLRNGERAAFAYRVANDELAMARYDDLEALRGKVAAERELQGSYDQTLSQLHRQVNLAEDATHAEQVLYEAQHGRLKGISDQQWLLLDGLAKELDHKRELTDQERQRIDILRESGQLRAANEAQWQIEYAERIAEYERQGNEEALKRLETLKRIREIQMNADQAPGTVEGVSRAPYSRGVDALFGGATGEILKLQEHAAELEAWRTTELEKQHGFLEAKAINEEVYAERVRNIHQQHQAELSNLEQARTQVSLAASEQMFGSLTNMAATFAGEQSDIYRAMFAVQKAAAIAQSIIAIQQGIAMAAANPWPANLGAMASVAAATAGIVSNIAAVGMAHDGIDSIPREGTWLLDRGERVVDRRTNADLKEYLAQGRGGKGGTPSITIHAPVTVEAQPGMSDEEVRRQGQITAGAIDAVLVSRIEKESRPGGLLWNLYGGGR